MEYGRVGVKNERVEHAEALIDDDFGFDDEVWVQSFTRSRKCLILYSMVGWHTWFATNYFN